METATCLSWWGVASGSCGSQVRGCVFFNKIDFINGVGCLHCRSLTSCKGGILCLHCTQEQVPSLVPSEKVHYKTPVTGSGDSQPLNKIDFIKKTHPSHLARAARVEVCVVLTVYLSWQNDQCVGATLVVCSVRSKGRRQRWRISW